MSAVPAANLASTSLSIDTESGTNIDLTGTVYNTVSINNFVFDADAICEATGDSDYVYGVKLTEAGADAVTNITTKVINSYK